MIDPREFTDEMEEAAIHALRNESFVGGESVSKFEEEFAKYTLDLFNDNDLCIQLKKNLYKIRNSSNWINSANSFLKVLKK